MRVVSFALLILVLFVKIDLSFAQSINTLWTEVLQDNVDDGWIDYANICQDKRLDQYLDVLQKTDLSRLSEQDEHAFWINVYNAYGVQIVCSKYPIKSVNDLHFGGLLTAVAFSKTVWDKKVFSYLGKKISLRFIEHEVLTKFNDGRSHLSISCTAQGCPPLRNSAYEGDDLDQQLDEQMHVYFNDERWNRIDVENKIAYISTILKWNMKYFVENESQLLLFISKYMPEEIKKSMQGQGDQWKIKFIDYDLQLNDVKLKQ